MTIDVRIYAERGNAESLDTKHSGTFVGMTDKGQGTSAKGYYWWNISDGFEDDEEISAEEYKEGDPTHYEEDGKFYKKISYFNSLDGVSQVYASKYELEDGRGGITKLVGKANYASLCKAINLVLFGHTMNFGRFLLTMEVTTGPFFKIHMLVVMKSHSCVFIKLGMERLFLRLSNLG